MRLITVTGLVAALAFAATPAFATKTGGKDQAAAEEASATAQKAERKVCKRLENTGTRMKNERVCLSKAEWQKLEDMK